MGYCSGSRLGGKVLNLYLKKRVLHGILHRDSELSDLLPNTVMKKNLRMKI